jgi:hypothetical protein
MGCSASWRVRRRSRRSPSRRTWAVASACSPRSVSSPRRWSGSTIEELLAGAREMVERCDTDDLERNPAGMFAVLQYLADTEAGAPIHVMMPYSDRLRDVADWFRQLWAESLGKAHTREGRRSSSAHAGEGARSDRPALAGAALHGGAVRQDDHLPDRGGPGEDIQIPSLYGDVAELGYLGGHTLGELLRVEMLATEAALAAAGTDEHDDRSSRRGRPLDRRALHAPADRHRLRRRSVRCGSPRPARRGARQAAHLRHHGTWGFDAQRQEWEAREPKRDDGILETGARNREFSGGVSSRQTAPFSRTGAVEWRS